MKILKILSIALIIILIIPTTASASSLSTETTTPQQPAILSAFPNIYHILSEWLNFRWQRIDFFQNISYDLIPYWHFFYDYDIHHPFLFTRFIMLVISTIIITAILETIADSHNWNWHFYTP